MTKKAKSTIKIYPLGGVGIQYGPVRLNYYGWNSLWVIDDTKYLLTLSDRDGIVLDYLDISPNFTENIPGAANDPAYQSTMGQPAAYKQDFVRPGTVVPGPIVTIRRGDPQLPTQANNDTITKAERMEYFKAIRKIAGDVNDPAPKTIKATITKG